MRRANLRGGAMLEAAICLAVGVPLLVGAVQFGVALLQLHQLEQAVHAAARHASRLTWESPSSQPGKDYQRIVENFVLFGGPEEAARPLLPNLRRDNVRIHLRLHNGVPAEVTVSITGFPLDLPGGLKTLNGSPGATFPYRGHFQPR